MIKTAQDAYLAGRQAAMVKLSSLGSFNSKILAANLGLKGAAVPVLGTVAGTGLGTYLGDKNLRSAGISTAGALGGGQIGANLGRAGVHALAAANGLTASDLAKYIKENGDLVLPEDIYNKLEDHESMANYIISGGNLLGQLAGGGAAGYYTKRG